MRFYKNKKILLVISILILISITLLTAWFTMMSLLAAPDKYNQNNISKLYDRDWVIGKTKDEIIKRYGRFSREYTDQNKACYYVDYDNGPIMPSYNHDTYWIIFDTYWKAIDAFFVESAGG